MQQPLPSRDAFATPAGLSGRIAGRVMALLNARMNRTAVALLEVPRDGRVLEVGFGPGDALEQLLGRAPDGLVTGVDPSAAMHAQAAGRNRAAVASGRLSLHRATADALPFPDRSFSHALSVNSFQIWSQPEVGLRELRRVLEDGGRLLLAVRVRSGSGRRPFDGIALDAARIEGLRAQLTECGFRDVELLVKPAGLMTAGCFRARA